MRARENGVGLGISLSVGVDGPERQCATMCDECRARRGRVGDQVKRKADVETIVTATKGRKGAMYP